MNTSVAEQHRAEVSRGERFQFGSNWARFLTTLSEAKIVIAEQSLQTALASTRLDGKTFLDIGSGSGLFSLAARRLGAQVRSFDYDPNSVACTKELKRRFFSTDENWIIEQGSVLDRAYLGRLGTFDIVYSWGVLHHTGRMWTALDNVKPLVEHGGQLYIAIYNDLGAITDRWRKIKRTYNHLPRLLQFPFALAIIGTHESKSIAAHLRRNNLNGYLQQWTQYQSVRGMNRWTDWIDWIGGYPYECATLEELIDFFGKDGFSLQWLESRAHGTGCNETVFRRQAGLGVFIDNPIAKSRFLLRRFGRRVAGPLRATSAGYLAKIPDALPGRTAESLVLFQDGKLLGPGVPGDESGTLIVASSDWPEHKVAATRFDVVSAKVRSLDPPFRKYSGHMFGAGLGDLKHLADDTMSSHNDSPVYVFEDRWQLGHPHSVHDDIVKHGAGRFSHWSQELLFSSSDNSDPRTNGRTYEIVIAEPDENGAEQSSAFGPSTGSR